MVKIKKELLIVLSLILMLSLVFLGFSFLKTETALAATYPVTISDAGVYHLYNDGTNGVDTKSLWTMSEKTIAGVGKGAENTSSGNVVKSDRGANWAGTPTITFTATINIDNKLQQAVNDGYVKIRFTSSMWQENLSVLASSGTHHQNLTISGDGVNLSTGDQFGGGNKIPVDFTISKLNTTTLNINFLSYGTLASGVGHYCRMENPTIEVIWDKEAPVINECTISNTNWSNENKILKIVTSDDYSGIQSVSVNGVELSSSSDENPNPSLYYANSYLKRTFEYEITENGQYNIVVTDNEGKQTVDSYTETKIDKGVPSNPILVAPTDWIHNGFSIEALLTNEADNGGSPLKYYYTIDGSTPDNTCAEFVKEGMTIDFGGNGIYPLSVAAIDEAGNSSEVVTQNIKIDNTRYQIQVNDKLGLSGYDIENLTRENEFLRGDIVKVTFEKEANYSIWGLIINDKEIPFEDMVKESENACSFTLTIDDSPYFAESFILDLKVREVLQVVVNKDTYIFDSNGIILNYEVTSKEGSEISSVISKLQPKFIKEGVEQAFFNNGEYDVIFYYADDNFVVDFTTKAVINKKQIEVVLDSVSSIYDGTKKEISIVEPDKEYQILADREVLNAGTYIITINVITDGKIDSNYIPQEIEYTVEKIKLTIGLGDIKNKQYDDTDKALGYEVISGEIIGNDLADLKVVREAGENVGSYNTYLENADNTNYDITYKAEAFEIFKRVIRVNFENNTLKYEKGHKEADLIVVLMENLKFENTSVNITEEMAKNALKLQIKDFDENNYFAGNYKVVYAGEENANFEFELVNANITFEKMLAIINPKVVKTATYGDEIVIEILSATGIPQDKIFLKLDGDKNVGIKNVVLDTDKMEAEFLNNYEIVLYNKSVEILPRKINVSVDGNLTKTYGEKDIMPSVVVDDSDKEFLENDNIVISLIREKNENVGSYALSLNVENDVNNNFEISLDKNYSYEITKREIVVTPDPISKVYGEDDGQITYTVNGLVNGNSAESILVGSLQREQGENVGDYKILIGSLKSASDNYYVTLKDDCYYDIEKAEFKLDLDNFETTYNGNAVDVQIDCDLALIVKYFQNGEEVVPVNAGDYNVEVWVNDGNYTQSKPIPTKLKIKQAVLFVELPKEEYYYTGEKIEYSGRVEGFDCTVKYQSSNGSEINEVIKPGVYTVIMEVAKSENYQGNTFRTTLTVYKKSVFINIEKDTFIYSGEAKAPVFTSSNSDIEAKIEYYIVDENGEEQRVLEPIGNAENDIVYRYVILIENDEYKGSFTGNMTIKKREVIVKDDVVIEVADKKDVGQELSFEIVKVFSTSDSTVVKQYTDFTVHNFKNKSVEEVYKVSSNDTSLENKYWVKIPVSEIANKEKLSVYVKKGDSFMEVNAELVGDELVIETNDVNMDILLLMDIEPKTFAETALRILAAFVGIGFLSFLTLKIRYRRKPVLFKNKFAKYFNKSK